MDVIESFLSLFRRCSIFCQFSTFPSEKIDKEIFLVFPRMNY